MKKIVALSLVALMLGAAPTSAEETKSSTLCGPDGPEAYKRPGGYCEQLGQGLSKSTDGAPKSDAFYAPVIL